MLLLELLAGLSKLKTKHIKFVNDMKDWGSEKEEEEKKAVRITSEHDGNWLRTERKKNTLTTSEMQ